MVALDEAHRYEAPCNDLLLLVRELRLELEQAHVGWRLLCLSPIIVNSIRNVYSNPNVHIEICLHTKWTAHSIIKGKAGNARIFELILVQCRDLLNPRTKRVPDIFLEHSEGAFKLDRLIARGRHGFLGHLKSEVDHGIARLEANVIGSHRDLRVAIA